MGCEPTNEDRAARIYAVRDAYWNARAETEDDAKVEIMRQYSGNVRLLS